MKVFQCSNCNFPVFFENTMCQNCGSALGYLSSSNQIISKYTNQSTWSINGQHYGYCQNYALQACNWLVPVNHTSGFCDSCNLNRTIPNLSVPEYFERWQKMEGAKHRLIYSLERLGLPVQSKFEHEVSGLLFDFLSEEDARAEGKQVMTGHANGVITILLAEADAVSREQIRKSLNEKYRTLIGHFRHEVGHYYWELIFKNNDNLLADFRAIFGDERQDYSEALKRHYANGAPANWKSYFISQYASCHPWEDWAETWAHYLHILDALETAYYFGLEGKPKLNNSPHMDIYPVFPYDNEMSFKRIIDAVSPLFYAVNSINRSMGLSDVYPFVISDAVEKKLEFIHFTLQNYRKNLA
ncbi:zinc-binding metallopeptidase family protein [Formosa sp. S-31]|uniref:zinc-binding metallopeptidase family protein n=1 Tax=Formosa sp. S-31 TaxID=2790949 RepID=UPI003EC13D0B